ncbi:toprim domain-containing protein [Chitinilyticum litopenaei]|uniref:toprim domain-containing protein n=1 Tax=Chitinilyticum litopenaei TaxID=1121276 RepID=UPI0004299B03|nr:toprim domain-containing protein [Chitinilyticum litopenaei]
MTPGTHETGQLGGYFSALKDRIDLHDLAGKLGLKRQGQNGNYHSPHHPDKGASLSVFNGGRAWKDHSGEAQGSCIDLALFCRPDLRTPLEAARLLGDWYGLPMPSASARQTGKPVEKTKAEFIAERCLEKPEAVVDYLKGRGISESVIRHAIQQKTLGWNTWQSGSIAAGQVGHGGPAAAFIVRRQNPARVAAVDLRYADPALNGGNKTSSQGERDGIGWTSDLQRLLRAHVVYLVESPINALSIETCAEHGLGKGFAALALRGTGNATKIDWAFLHGKRVIVALDQADAVNPVSGERPGLKAAWALNDELVRHGIAAQFVDMMDWEDGEDINDVLQQHGAAELAKRLKRLEPWLIAGMPAGSEADRSKLEGRRRIFLPAHDLGVYWRFRCRPDFTQYVEKFEQGNEDEGPKRETLGDLCSFRIAALTRLRIQGHQATLSGMPDTSYELLFGISAQTARHGDQLCRHVATEDKLHNLDWWGQRFGAIWKPGEFKRMVNILERTAGLHEQSVVNFVGLAWSNGELTAREGKDCFFLDPDKQCPYAALTFPRGTPEQAARVIRAYQQTFKQNAASMALVWVLGAHLKNVLDFYPHFQMQAEKGAGKSKLMESLERHTAFTVFSGQSLKTDHRRRMSVSYTSQPVAWDEFSKLPRAVLGDIDELLQSTYRSSYTKVGASALPYLMCAPVLLAGEEVDVQSLQSKICRTTLSVAKQGPLLPRDLPQFPLWQWLQFLAKTAPGAIRESFQRWQTTCSNYSRASQQDPTAARMRENYAAILTAWTLLCDFTGLDQDEGDFVNDLLAEMNRHITETDSERQPWVWIMEIFASELEAGRFDYPYCWSNRDGEPVLCVRAAHIMDHLSTASHLRSKFDAMPIKTSRVFKQQLLSSGAVIGDEATKVIAGRRVVKLQEISIKRLGQFNIHLSPSHEQAG